MISFSRLIWISNAVFFLIIYQTDDDFSHRQYTRKMHLQKWSQNILDTNAAILHIWSRTLSGSDHKVELWQPGPDDTHAQLIASIFIAWTN